MKPCRMLIALLALGSLSACATQTPFELRPATAEDTLVLSFESVDLNWQREDTELARSSDGRRMENGIWRSPGSKLPMLTLEHYATGFNTILTAEHRAKPDKVVQVFKDQGHVVGVGDLVTVENSLGPLDYTRIELGAIHCVHFSQLWGNPGVVNGVDKLTTSGSAEEVRSKALYTDRIEGLFCEESTFPTRAERLQQIFDGYRVAGLPFDD